MCGIGGCVVPPGQLPVAERLESMRAALAHRGPDDSGVEIEGNVGLVHARLAIVDPSEHGHQPMRRGRWLLSYNGEVFNHLELRDALEGIPFEGGSDTETVLQSLARWGEEAVPRFNGLFAFAALDLEQKRLLLVRDRFGVKPLYLARHDNALWFASEIGALLAAGVPARASGERIAQTLDFGFITGAQTPFEGIERVPPGSIHSIDLETLGRTERRWYDPARAVDAERQAELERRPASELVDLIEHDLRASVHRRLMADVPIGAMCSGGVDSSLVAAFAREQHDEIVLFNFSVQGGGRQDEGPAAGRAAAALGLELQTVEMTPASWRASFVESVRHFEYPLANPSAVAIAQVADLARSRGVKTLLTGEGADELGGGYWSRNRSAFIDFLPFRDRAGRALESAQRLGVAGTVSAAVQKLSRRRHHPPWLTDDEMTEPDRIALEDASRAYAHHPDQRGQLEAELLSNLSLTLPHLLNRMDKNAMQSSVEARLPFLDPGLVELMVNLPLEARTGPRSKGLLRDVARRHLPRTIANRPKIYGMGFEPGWLAAGASPPFLRDGRLRDLLQVPGASWTELIERARHAHEVRFWSAEVWCRTMIDGQSDQSVERELFPNGP